MIQEARKSTTFLSLVFFCGLTLTSAQIDESTERQLSSKPSTLFVNIALVVPPNDEISYHVLQNSLDLINRDLRTKGSGVRLNVFRVVVREKELFSDATLFAKNLTTASFLLEPFAVSPNTCHLADMLSIPHIILTETFPKRCRHTLSFRPSNKDLFVGAMAMLRQLKPRVIAVICESALSESAIKFISLDQFNKRLSFQLTAVLDFNNSQTISDAITEVKLSSKIFRVLLVVRSQHIPIVLQEAENQGLDWDDYKWFSPWVGMSITRKRQKIAPLVGLRIPYDIEAWDAMKSQVVSSVPFPREDEETIDPLIHDALTTIAMATGNTQLVDIKEKRTVTVGNYINPCPLRRSNDHGDQVYSNAKKLSFDGLTGRVRFTKQGYREVMDLEIISIGQGIDRKLGMWSVACQAITMTANSKTSLQRGQVSCKREEKKEDESFRPDKRHLSITTLHDPPLIFVDQTKEGNERFTGFCKDLLDVLSKELNFTYTMYVVEDGSFGTKHNESWDGMIKDLIIKKADVAVGSLTITSLRETAVDFTKPFLDFTMSLILRKPAETEVDIFTFLKPFKGELWLSVVGVLFTVAFFIYLLDYYSPDGFHRQAKESGQDNGDEFNFSNCVWFATGSMLQQGPDSTPKNFPTRILSAVFWFFILIIVSTYTANLAAFFTTGRVSTTITSLEDLAKQEEVEYGIYEGGQTYGFFKTSDLSLYRKMWAQMVAKDTFAKSTKIAIKRVRSGGYAYLTEDPILSYYNQRAPCNTYLLRNLLKAKSYGFALKSDSQWTNHLSVKILELREKGIVEELRLKWWDARSECPSANVKAIVNPSLELSSMAGVYVFLLSGVILCFLFLFYEMRFPDGIKYLQRGMKKQQTFRPTATYRDIKKMDTVDSGIVKMTDYRDGSNSPTTADRFDHIPTKRYFDQMNQVQR